MTKPGPKPRENAKRFWSHVQTSDDCWIWTAWRGKKGYGLFAMRLQQGGWKTVLAHRFAYELIIGPIPEGKVLDHIECDNPSCVNPGHTVLSTIGENMLRGTSP